MLSKNKAKYIRSLGELKFRSAAGRFLAETGKLAAEYLRSGWSIELVAGTEDWLHTNRALLDGHPEAERIVVSEEELARISQLRQPAQVLLVAAVPEAPALDPQAWTLVLDDIRDPGNMGTLIRIADWFGIPQLVASPGSADFFNPKVVQAAMGSHTRVALLERDLPACLAELSVPKLAATLDGTPAYEPGDSAPKALIIGNEARGISDAVLALADGRITIPRLGGAESLNASVAAGILCAQLRLPRAL